MKILKHKEPDLKENRVELYYNEIDAETEKILKYFGSYDKVLTGRNETETKMISPSEIYYCEIVDRRCYCYLNNSVWRVDSTLQMLLDQFCSTGFVRISKSMIVNVYKIDRLKTNINMRIDIVLENGETVILNRAYRKQFYQFLENIRTEMR